MAEKRPKKINLALQGGGTHGAFTWGVLDKFLEENVFSFEGISATSAGSVNAVVLVQGLMEGGNDGARQLLYDFWRAVSVTYENFYSLKYFFPFLPVLEHIFNTPINILSSLGSYFSPYDFNPFNINPMQNILEGLIDVDAIKRKSKIKLFICATNVRTGSIHIFDKNELSIPVILASACLPKIHQAVNVNGEYYWDGGYSGNPAIFPLIYHTHTRDILIVHLVPTIRANIPKSVLEIDTRLREVKFNSSLLREMRVVEYITKLIDEGWIKKEYLQQLPKENIHCLRGDNILKEFPLTSVVTPEWGFLQQLRDLGRHQASLWLKENYQSVGKKSTVSFSEWES